MKLPVQITIRDFINSAVLKDHILHKVKKLNEINPRIMSCRVIVEMPQKHKRQGKLFNVKIDLTIPGEEITISKNADEDIYITLREAFDDAKRRLEYYARKNQHNGKVHHAKVPMRGYISQLYSDEGYGFIEAADGHSVYFNECVLNHVHMKHLDIGMPVQFLEEMGEKGPQACRVKVRPVWYEAA